MKRRTFMTGTVAAIALLGANAALAEPMADAKALVEKYASKVSAWDGPTAGPKAQDGKTIVVLAGDLKNGGILGVTTGVEEAAAAIGWQVKVLDGAGSIGGRTGAFGQAMALKPDGIIINGFDAVEQAPALEQAKAAGIPLVAWHAGPLIGPDEKTGLFANISTDAMEVSKAAANWAYVDAGGKPGVVIFTDSTYAIA
ncbi:MAG TPA: substrate-binding domain-containing protein, partial [Sinorhizobium sp.]|nr:substrate-binding domain-containing protein [Sinorhizobium sp.]